MFGGLICDGDGTDCSDSESDVELGSGNASPSDGVCGPGGRGARPENGFVGLSGICGGAATREILNTHIYFRKSKWDYLPLQLMEPAARYLQPEVAARTLKKARECECTIFICPQYDG